MIFDIKGLGGVKGTDKTKAKAKTGAAGGPNFADMLSEAQSADEVASEAPVGVMTGVAGGFAPIEDDLPKDGKGQAKEMVQKLRELAEDALSGSPSAAVDRLQALAADVDESALSAEQKKVLDEVRTRAAVEVAKLKG